MSNLFKKNVVPTFEQRLAETERAQDNALALAEMAAQLFQSASTAQDSLYGDINDEIARLEALQSQADDYSFDNDNRADDVLAAIA